MTSRSIIHGFVQYAHLDEELVVDLLDRLAVRLNGDQLGVDWWRDRQGELGDPYSPEIIGRIETAQVLLQCLSPNFLAKANPAVNGYIWDHEMPAIQRRGASLYRVPVGLVTFDPSHGRGRGIEDRTYHLLPGPKGSSLFYKILDDNGRDEFARQLANRMYRRFEAMGLVAA